MGYTGVYDQTVERFLDNPQRRLEDLYGYESFKGRNFLFPHQVPWNSV